MLKGKDECVGGRAHCCKVFHYMCGRDRYSQSNDRDGRVINWTENFQHPLSLKLTGSYSVSCLPLSLLVYLKEHKWRVYRLGLCNQIRKIIPIIIY